MPEPQISIVIPCYNHGQYVPEALASLEGITMPFEVIIVDDGSTDPQTVAILASLEGREGVTLIRQANAGVGSARNNGIGRARAPFVVPLDADNRLSTVGLQKAYEQIQNNDRIAVVYGDAEFFGQQTGVWVNKPLNVNEMIMSNQIDNCVLLRKGAWQDVGGYMPDKTFQSHADWLMWLNLLSKGWRFQYLGDKFFEYRVLQDSMLRTDGKAMRKVTKISAFAYSIQKELIANLVRDRVLTAAQAQHLLGRVESQLAYYQLLYGSFGDGLRNWTRSVMHAPQMILTNLRIAIVCPVKRIASDVFNIDLSLKMAR